MEGDHQDGSEDASEGVLVETSDGYDVKMPQEARSDIVVDGCHRVEEGEVDRLLKHLLLLLEVIEPALVYQLSQELDGWLGTVLLLHRHVQIIDEDDGLGDALRPYNMPAASLVQSSLYLFLHLRASCP